MLKVILDSKNDARMENSPHYLRAYCRYDASAPQNTSM
jgi:hypothetical protein